jgi:hypothetical protein
MDSDVFPEHSRDAARRQLEPFHDRFIAAIREAVRKFNAIEPPTALYALSKSKRAKATAIWAFIMEEVRTTMSHEPGLRLVEQYGTIEIHVGDNMVARIKKMRPDGFTSNYMTPRVTDFHSADQGELFEHMWGKPLRVDVGYIEDETGMQVAQILVAHRRNPGSIDWTYEMTPPADVLPLPVGPMAPAPTTDPARVVARVSENANPNKAQGTDE